MSRKLELVVARAAGVSVWQFGLPPLIVALAIGLGAMVAYNPIAVNLKQRAAALEGRIFMQPTQTGVQNRFIASFRWTEARS